MFSRFSNAFQGPTGPATGYTVYIAGPISGDLAGNLPAFFDAEQALRAAGHSTFNPARTDGGSTAAEAIDLALANAARRTWADYMKDGLAGLSRCNAYALLPGWHRSSGARLESQVAMALGYAKVHPDGDLMRDDGLTVFSE